MSRTAFLNMYRAYIEAFGGAYPQRDPISVFKVLEECAGPVPTTQVAITSATGVKSGEVNKIIDKADQKGWVDRQETRTSSGAKMLSLTDEGRRVLSVFNERCMEACAAAVSPNSPVAGERKVTKHAAKRKARSGSTDATDADVERLVGSSGKQS